MVFLMRARCSRFFLFVVVIFLAPLAIVKGHGLGVVLEEVVDRYVVTVNISEQTVRTNEPVRFDFLLFDEATQEEVPFTDLWMRISRGQLMYFAGGISRPEFGATGFSYRFIEEGEYSVNVRYQQDGNGIVEYTIPVVVTGTGSSASGGPFADPKSIAAMFAAFVVGFGMAYIIMKRAMA